jgi:hypothetical protein
LNNFGVWNEPGGGSANFNRDLTVNFPSSGQYTFEMSVDNAGQVYLDGAVILTIDGFQFTNTTTIFVGAGNHLLQLRGQNYHGPGSFGLTINGGAGYNGGRGGRAGFRGSSGGGGGGGGATVLRLNNTVLGVAGGGGGGGGAGILSGTQPANAPGPAGQSGSAVTIGSDGGDRGGGVFFGADGGGGGGGGGGQGGGNGGPEAPYDTWGYAGFYGGNLGNSGQTSTGRLPGGAGNAFWSGGAGIGGANGAGSGTPGYAVLEFEIDGTFVNIEGTFRPVKQTWVNQNGVWRPAQGVFVNQQGTWRSVDGTFAPNFSSTGSLGYISRANGT